LLMAHITFVDFRGLEISEETRQSVCSLYVLC